MAASFGCVGDSGCKRRSRLFQLAAYRFGPGGELARLLFDRSGELRRRARVDDLPGGGHALSHRGIRQVLPYIRGDALARRVAEPARAGRDQADQPIELELREAGFRDRWQLDARRARAVLYRERANSTGLDLTAHDDVGGGVELNAAFAEIVLRAYRVLVRDARHLET